MATQLSVINKAVRFLGQDELASPEQFSSIALSAYAAWDDALDWCLRCHPWNFAQKWETLAELTSKPPFSYRYSYLLPSDCVRLVDVRSDEDLALLGARFAVAGRVVYTNASPCLARYIYRVTDPTFWPADFTEVVSYKVALDIAAVIIPGDSAMRKDIDQRFFVSLDVARKNDMSEDNAPELNATKMSPSLMARYEENLDGGY